MIRISKELINGETSLVGVLGSPVGHSLSPIIHNAALTALNLNWCYLAIPCHGNNLELVLKALRAIDCKGLNITIPHKNNALHLCHQVDPLAKRIGAVNTLIPTEDMNWDGRNTDIEGFLAPLEMYKDWSNKKALILGCGGSSKAVLHGLDSLNLSKITIVSRKEDSLSKFLNEINISNYIKTNISGLIQNDISLEENIRNANLIINTTPVGMYNSSNKEKSLEIPLGKEIWKNLQPETILYDLIYRPKPTEWLKLGEQYQCHQIDGLEMLIQQGAASLRIWSGIKIIPLNVMRKAAEKALLN